MISLTRGVPAPESFPIEEFIESFAVAMREDGKKALSYVAAPGYLPLLEIIAKQEGVELENILVGNGSLEFLQFITMVAVEPGDRVFVESPSYDRANKLMKRRGLVPVGIPLQLDGVDVDRFEDELKKGAPKFYYSIPDFQNPMGVTMSLEKRKQIVALAQEYDFMILEDIPYRLLRYTGEDVPTMWSLDPSRVVKMNSFSKTLAPGLRLGYLVGPKEFIAKVKQWEVDTFIGPVSPTQALAYQYLKAGKFLPNLERLKALYAPRQKRTIDFLEANLPGASFPRPEGGFFLGVMLPEGNDMAELIPAAKEAGVAITDGRGFFLNPDEGKRFLRIPFCGLKPEEIDTALSTLLTVIKQ